MISEARYDIGNVIHLIVVNPRGRWRNERKWAQIMMRIIILGEIIKEISDRRLIVLEE